MNSWLSERHRKTFNKLEVRTMLLVAGKQKKAIFIYERQNINSAGLSDSRQTLDIPIIIKEILPLKITPTNHTISVQISLSNDI